MGKSTSVTVLIGDRNSRIREFMGREFATEGYRVLLAGDGWEVFRILRQEPRVDLLVLDPDIPNRHGDGLLERIREEHPDLPIVVHSWRTDEHPFSPSYDASDSKAPMVLVVKNGSMDRLKGTAQQLMGGVPDWGDGT
ncbi:MAG: response regulator [Desulfovibrio sp.]|uniref:response regulator n=1 Tax=Desulfovibrio sp. 7SRBS1 TaxID=3378064 RepID=UPI003B40B7B6